MKSGEQVLFLTLRYLDDTMLARACQVNARFYQRLCHQFWLQRLLNRYSGIIDTFPPEIQQKSVRDQYVLLRDLEQLKSLLIPLVDLSLLEIYQLQELDVHNNQLTELPREIGRLDMLQELYVYNNQLTELPREIGQLGKLQELHVYNNRLTELPREIGQLGKLQRLDVSDNQLTELPREIGQLGNLQLLYVYNNPKIMIPEEIRNRPDLKIVQ